MCYVCFCFLCLMRSIQYNVLSKSTAVVVQLLSCVWLLATPWTAACQTSLSFPMSWSLLKLMCIESVMPSNHFILCHPLLLQLSIFPSIRVFSNEPALRIRWTKYSSFSLSILRFTLKLTSLILQSKGLSRVFSNITIHKHQFFSTQLSLWSNSHIHTWPLEKPELWLSGPLPAK